MGSLKAFSFPIISIMLTTFVYHIQLKKQKKTPGCSRSFFCLQQGFRMDAAHLE